MCSLCLCLLRRSAVKTSGLKMKNKKTKYSSAFICLICENLRSITCAMTLKNGTQIVADATDKR